MPHRHDLKVFVVSPKHPAGPTRPGPTLSVEAPTLDGLLPAAKQALAEAGIHRERAISFTPTGLVAYVEDEG
ncbi:MAG TPA: hypothetical protein RMH85_20880 [Polyangiaceae bacterium LLY-WYZ-15_(1-7)]|nr:hypothetical protein [Myxococcales bacterium]MAT23346.1 hypothetical protein [Sandaracinus sp.]HJK94565.1 hypothetical protein [Polyangiaceae bacterium LLY-WYZ-15_(1-7)]HJL10942.1 hypothetical protein [Polyangiaceae bacterium LLY-WYZ-15_(1-7)]HJL23082.1 hypothetical protein [Polyangiaceae bacterium LLY-WYZ-15_(1-7)]